MANNHPAVQNAINHGYSFSVSESLGKAWQTIKGDIGLYIAYFVTYMIIVVTLAFIPFIGTIVNWFIGPALAVGMAIATAQLKQGRSIELQTFFKGFDKWLPLFVGALLKGLIYLAAMIPIIALFFIFVFGNLALFEGGAKGFADLMTPGVITTMIFAYFGLLLLFAVLYAYLMWVSYLIYFHDYTDVEAIKASYHIGKQQLWSHIKISIMSFLLMLGGILCFGIGLLVAIPLIQAMVYEIYAEITNKDDEEKGMDILDHFTPLEEL